MHLIAGDPFASLFRLKSAFGSNGGRDRDRTCDPYHVKVVLFR